MRLSVESRRKGEESHLEQMVKSSRRRTVRKRIVAVLAAFIVAFTGVGMVLPANTATAQLICGKEEHTHTDACYTTEKVLTCGQEESADHQHTDACYTEETVLTCDKEEHTHTAECYEQGGTLTAKVGDDMSASVSYEAGVLHEGTSMEASVPDENNTKADQSLIEEAAGENWQIAALYPYTLSFYKDGQQVEPDGDVDVTMSYRGASVDADDIQWKLYHITDDGQAEEVTEKGNKLSFDMIDDQTVGSVSFKASSFSDYVLTALVPAKEETAAETAAQTEKKQESVAAETEVCPKPEKGASEQTENAQAEKTAASTRRLPARAPAKEDGSVDLGDYLTGFTAYKKNGDKWEENTHFNDGDSAKFSLDFEIKSGDLEDGQRTLTYSLPAGTVLPTDGQSGKVTQNGIEVGDYSITTDGKITITLNDKYDTNTAFEGNITFEGTVKNTGGQSGTDVDFGTDDSIHIGPKADDTDLHISKQAYLQTDGEYADYIMYTIRVYSTKGTSGPIYLDDQMTGLNSFDADDIKGWSVIYDQTGGEGQEREHSDKSSEIKPTYYSDGRNGWYVTLPQMDKPPAEWFTNYNITYYVKPDAATAADGKKEVGNTASANDGIRWVNDSKSVIIQDSLIKKSVTADDTTRKLHWKIVIKNPDHHDFSFDQFKDQMTVDGKPVDPPDTVYIGSQAITVNENGTFTLPANSSGEYTIDYYTDYPEGPKDTHIKVNNKIEYTHDGKTYTSEDGRDVIGDQSVYDVGKWNYPNQTQTDEDGKGATLHWASTVYLPEETIPNDKVVYTDTLSAQNGSEELTDKHYTTAALLNQMAVWLTKKDKTSGDSLTAGTDFKIYDISDGTEKDITGSTDSTTHITKFKVVLTDDGLGKVQGMGAINYSYDTRASYDGQEGKSTWKFSNNGEIPEHSADASFDHNKDYVLDKMSSATGPNFQDQGNNNFNYKDSGVTVDRKDGIIYYAVVLKVPQGTTGDMVLKDTLPAGLSYKTGSESIAIYNGNNDATRNYSDGKGTLSVTASATEKQGDGSSKVNFTVTGYRPGEAFVLYYQAEIKDEDYWKDQTKTDKDYSNKIEWNNYSDTTKTHVEQNKKVLDKVHQLKTNDDGTRQLTYFLKLNPSGGDVDPNSDTLTLTDTLKTDNSGAKPYFDPATIKVYQYDPDMANGVGAEIDKSRYAYQYDESTHKLTLTVPDQLACVISYQYKVTVGVNDAVVSNTAELTGVAGSSTTDEQKLETSSSQSSVKQNVLVLYKVDSENYRIKLSGVKFRVEEYKGKVNNEHVWEPVNGKDEKPVIKTTDQNGEIKFTTIDDNLHTNTLYRLVETDVGNNPGYVENSEPYMFIWKDAITYTDSTGSEVTKKDPTKDDYFNSGILPSGADNLDRSKVNLIDGTGNIYYPNEKHAITVNKVWLNKDNKDLNDPTKTATVRLYRRTSVPDGYKVTVNVTYSGGVKLDPYVFYIDRNTSTATLKLLNIGPGTCNGVSYTSGYNSEYGAELATVPISDITGDTVINIQSGWGSENKSKAKIIAEYSKPAKTNYGEVQYINAYGQVVSNKEDANVTLGSDNSWSSEWYNLPYKDESGTEYAYFIEEDPVDGFTTSISNNGISNDGIITVTNKSDTQVKHASFDFIKKWFDKDGYETDWPEDITVTLTGTKEGSTISSKFTIHQNSDGSFTAAKVNTEEENGIPSYSFGGGKTADGTYKLKFDSLPDGYTYSLTEDPMSDYNTAYGDDAAAGNISEGGTITNSKTGGEKTNFSFTKQWYLENRLSTEWQKDIVVILTGKASDTSIIASKYTIHKGDDGFTITKSNIDGTKKIPDNAVCRTSGTGDGNFVFTFTDLPKTDVNGNEYKYSVTEDKVTGFQDPVYETGTNGESIIQNKNFPTKYTELEVDKKWLNSDGSDLSSVDVDSVHVKLFQVTSDKAFADKPTDGGTLYGEYDVKKSEGWKLNIKDLPSVTYDENGTPVYYSYYISESPVTGYTSKQEVDSTSGKITLTNTKLTEGKSITVNKTWSGVSSDQIKPVEVELHRVGNGTPATIHLMKQYEYAPATEKQTITHYSDGSQIMVGDIIKFTSEQWFGNTSTGPFRTGTTDIDLTNYSVADKDSYIYLDSNLWDLTATAVTKNTAASDNVLATQTLSGENNWSYSWDLTKIDGYTYNAEDKFYVKETNTDTSITTTIKYVDKNGNEVSSENFNNGTATVTNTGQYQDFNFTKIWEDSNGDPVTWPSLVNSLTFTLTGTGNGGKITYTVTVAPTGVTISPVDGSAATAAGTLADGGDNKYSISITGMPSGYTYTLTESAVDGYDVKYQDSNADNGSSQTSISSGQIITNKQQGGYVLPETGGTGTIRYIGSGALLMAAAMLLYIKKKFHEGRRTPS